MSLFLLHVIFVVVDVVVVVAVVADSLPVVFAVVLAAPG